MLGCLNLGLTGAPRDMLGLRLSCCVCFNLPAPPQSLGQRSYVQQIFTRGTESLWLGEQGSGGLCSQPGPAAPSVTRVCMCVCELSQGNSCCERAGVFSFINPFLI